MEIGYTETIVVLLALGLLFAGLLIWSSRMKRVDLKPVFERIGLGRDVAEVEAGRGYCRLTFTHNGCKVRMQAQSLSSSGGGYRGGSAMRSFTVVETKIPARENLSFTLYREDALDRLGQAVGMQDVKLSDPEFDQAFVVKASIPDQMQAIFDLDTRHKMLSIKGINLCVDCEDGRFRVSCPSVTDDEAILRAMIDLHLKILDRLAWQG